MQDEDTRWLNQALQCALERSLGAFWTANITRAPGAGLAEMQDEDALDRSQWSRDIATKKRLVRWFLVLVRISSSTVLTTRRQRTGTTEDTSPHTTPTAQAKHKQAGRRVHTHAR